MADQQDHHDHSHSHDRSRVEAERTIDGRVSPDGSSSEKPSATLDLERSMSEESLGRRKDGKSDDQAAMEQSSLKAVDSPPSKSSRDTDHTSKEASIEVNKGQPLTDLTVDEFGFPIKSRAQKSTDSDDVKECDSPENAGDVDARKAKDGEISTGHRDQDERDTQDSIAEDGKDKEDDRTRGRSVSQGSTSDERFVQRTPTPVQQTIHQAEHESAERNQHERSRTPTSPEQDQTSIKSTAIEQSTPHASPAGRRKSSSTADVLSGNTGAVSGWSHQALAPQVPEELDHDGEAKAEEEWHEMPSYAQYDLYDDDGNLVAREAPDSDEEANPYHGLGGAGKGYTRVQLDEDAKSATSLDDDTNYLFKQKETDAIDDDEQARDPLAQLQATKGLLTEGQRIAYVGITRLAMAEMVTEMEKIDLTKATKKCLTFATESLKMWSQKIMVRLYKHMEIDSSEQIMIEQLAEHGVLTGDLTPQLMLNARVKNPMAEKSVEDDDEIDPKTRNDSVKAHTEEKLHDENGSRRPSQGRRSVDDHENDSLPAYEEQDSGDMPKASVPSQLGTGSEIDIDLRWTVLCDLFLVLLADSAYDSRSRTLLERVGQSLSVPWQDICRFEKRVTDALEMQETENKETWDEAEHLETRRKRALKRRYMMMGLATVGGSLVIGLSAGLLAPVIGAGLAAGFSTIGVAGTGTFLAGAGGTALITSGAVVTGGTIAVRASNRRMGAVKTFEYRPLHNNKRVNLILTVSGWMSGKVDDVRLPFSTIDPVMGDIYSLLWEPEMLQSMGQTINILATEALTQGLQQVLGSTILVALMASLQLPIVLTKLSYLIDNPWTVSMGRANAAGLILADSLIDRNLGIRPITLVGFSLGSRVIFACLRELANKGAIGIVQNVFLFGSPIVNNREEYLRCRSVVSGRFVNGYASNDWILGYLFRATSGGVMRVAGLAPVQNVPGLENLDVTKLVNGHMAYRAAMPRLLREVGWEVESDEFTEIEDPDPDNHELRQRELIRELDEARREAETKPEKKRFGFFKRGKLAEKRGWETYDDKMKDVGDDFSPLSSEAGQHNILFDIEAIKAELASEQIEVKQLESTLPPMKLDLSSSSTAASPMPSPGAPSAITTAAVPPAKSSAFSFRRLHRPVSSQSSAHQSKTSDGPYGYEKYDASQDSLPTPRLSDGDDKSSHNDSPPVANPITVSTSRPQVTSAPRSYTETTNTTIPSYLSPSNPSSTSQTPTPIPLSTPTSSIRPGLYSTSTSPAAVSMALGSEHQVWAHDNDEDGDEYGQEREVQLSF